MKTFIGLNAFQIYAIISAGLTLLILAEAFIGHYKSGFGRLVQYVPFVSGGLLIIAVIAKLIFPSFPIGNRILAWTGWLSIATGLIGFGFHHYFGMTKKPGGYKWLLHHLMYGAPQLAPLALSATGVLALIAASGLEGVVLFWGVTFQTAVFGFVAICMFGAILQAGILHYRGAFNNPLMYAPLTAPLLAVVAAIWAMIVPQGELAITILAIALWLTFLIGFVGLGMHLRGYQRQMGGLNLWKFNLMEGAPPTAPAFFTGIASVGLTSIYL